MYHVQKFHRKKTQSNVRYGKSYLQPTSNDWKKGNLIFEVGLGLFFCALCYVIKTYCFSAKQKQNSLTVETAMHARFDFPPSPRGRTKYIKYAAPYYNTVIVHTTYQSSATSIDQWLVVHDVQNRRD